ncbi:MAG: DNA repair protein RadC [Anaerolineae bacterium]|jgi:DNA repair protein RadC|uniref:RadC family protein n=1 Tax=Candidatus Amarolinea dominans TaxID=3140696 RepID=UPI0031CC5B2C
MSESAGVEYTLLIRNMPTNERPRERLQYYGAGALASSELIAILLRVGTEGESVLHVAQRLLSKYGGLPGLARASFDELCQEKALGPAKVTQIKAALELGKRLLVSSPLDRPQVRSPAEAAELLMAEMGLLEQEQLRTILLDTRNTVIGIPIIYQGSLNSAAVRVGEMFRHAIKANAAAMIVAHNHPSGDPAPSPEDVRVTRSIVEAGKLLDIDVLDHVVIGHQRFVSMKERGLGF